MKNYDDTIKFNNCDYFAENIFYLGINIETIDLYKKEIFLKIFNF